MTFPIAEVYHYGLPSATQTLTMLPVDSLLPYAYSVPSAVYELIVDSNVAPSIEIISSPSAITNSLQANFTINVYHSVSSNPLVNANLFFKIDNAVTYTALGTARELIIQMTAGIHEIFFTAESNGIFSEAPIQYSWTVDTISPSVTNIQPANGMVQVSVNPSIVVEFSENMDPINTIAALSIEPAVAGVWNASGNLFTFVPTVGLAYDQSYIIRVADTAKDLAGNSILAPSVAQFATIQGTNNPPFPPNFTGRFVPAHTSAKNLIIPFNVPTDVNGDALHFIAEIATNATFTNNLQTYNTINHADLFIYYDRLGNKIGNFPSMGVAPGMGQVIFNPRLNLSNGQYWVRFFADDRR